MASENILMYCVSKKGKDRQALHEAIRTHAIAAAEQVKLYGRENDLLARILADERFGLTKAELDSLIDPRAFIGLADRQTLEYVNGRIMPILEKNREFLDMQVQINV
jgi:adenylosuccinate lyase